MNISEPEWQKALSKEFDKDYFLKLLSSIEMQRQSGKTILPFPCYALMFRAYELCPLSRVKVVILGQDPYPNMKDAMGLSFSVHHTRPIPKSLNNMFKELKTDLGIVNKTGDLTFWAAQGVFLLNTVLTVNEGESNSHKGFGWETFTDETLRVIGQNKRFTVYWLLGKDAQKKEQLIVDSSKEGCYHILKLPHPSPFSASTGFFWSKPFSKTNELLKDNGLLEINWQL